jgi:hypothetical protein
MGTSSIPPAPSPDAVTWHLTGASTPFLEEAGAHADGPFAPTGDAGHVAR